jgi:two-component sensor histidine kinase
MNNEEGSMSELARRPEPGRPIAEQLQDPIFELGDRMTKSPARLARELANAIALQRISTRLIHEKDLDALYREIVAAAMAIMRSDFGSMQVYDQARNELYLLVSENFEPESAKFWEWVSCGEASACGQALKAGERIVIPDVEACEALAGTDDLDHHRRCGMSAVQSTPLVARDGRAIGMISTHWNVPHEPDEADLRMLDVLARQAADLVERTQAEERRKLLVNELNHRVKNTLAIVQALAQQSFRGSKVSKDVRESFEGRLEALASTHDLLTRTHWESTDLNDVVREALAACGVSDRATVKGPPLLLGASSAVTFAMALHELCTNAIKYGALSVETGRVSIAWAISINGERRFEFEWRESGGPTVATPDRRGFGSRLIERALASDLKGKAKLDFRAEGVRFRLEAAVPAQTVTATS